MKSKQKRVKTRRITNTLRVTSSNKARLLFALAQKTKALTRNTMSEGVKYSRLFSEEISWENLIYFFKHLNTCKSIVKQSAGGSVLKRGENTYLHLLRSLKWIRNSTFLNISIFVFLIVTDSNPFTMNCVNNSPKSNWIRLDNLVNLSCRISIVTNFLDRKSGDKVHWFSKQQSSTPRSPEVSKPKVFLLFL